MKIKFDDYKYKRIDKKIEFTLKQEVEKKLSPWELSSFINKFNTYYYKNELLNTIAIALNNGISAENIIIFDESFKLNRIYNKFVNISLKDKNIKYLYTLGKPVSLFPNENIFIINLIFKYFRNINEFLRKKFKKTLTSDNIYEYYQIYKKDGLNNSIDRLRKDANDVLSKVKIDKTDLKNLNNFFNSLEHEFNIFNQNKYEIDNLTLKLKSKDLDLKKFDKKDLTYKKYFSKFYNLLTIIQRPVLAIYDEETQSMDILCRAHINKNERNAVTLDLKSLKHNSPFEGIFNAGLSAYSTIQDEKRLNEIHEYDKELKELDLEIRRKELVNLEVDLEIKKVQLLRQKIAVIKELNEFKDSNEINSINTMENPYLKEQISELSSNIHDKAKSLLYNNKFQLEDVKIIDIRA